MRLAHGDVGGGDARGLAADSSASGIATGTQTSTHASVSLPVAIRIALPSAPSGNLHLDVLGVLGGSGVGQGATDVSVVAGRHVNANVALAGIELTDGAVPDDAGGGGDDLAGSVPCTVADNACVDANTLASCRSDGTGLDSIACAAGCSTTGSPHCRLIVPTAPVTTTDSNVAGTAAVNVASGEVRFNSDNGLIAGAITRPANTNLGAVEVHAGIAFHVAGGVGIFAFGPLTVAPGATLKIYGTIPVALVSSGDVLVAGIVDARPFDATGALCAGTVGGPGGGQGGAPGTVVSGMPSSGSPGTGMGPGGGSTGVTQGGPGGGGGGGHFAGGATGADGCHLNSPASSGGTGGITYGPGLQGGSGGGGAGAFAGVAGGGGGGAVQLTATGIVTIGDGTDIEGINAGGCGGVGGTAAGGGGSGGSILVEAPVVQLGIKGTLAANGGGGGANDGSGGNDTGAPGSLSASIAFGGGSSTAGGTRGGNGGAGNTPAGGAPLAACTGQGFGGGGAAGRVTINTVGAGPSVNAQAVISPSTASGGATFGTSSAQ